MSAFLCILDRSGSPLDQRRLEALSDPLEPYGGEVATFCQGPVGIVVRHAGGGAAEERHGPLADPASGLVVALAGRFGPLEAGATFGGGAARPTGARAACLEVAGGWPAVAELLAKVAGAFVLVVADPERQSLTVARDHLGSLKVYYFLDDRWLIAASEPTAILRHPAVADDLDERAAARFLGFSFSPTGRSFFRQIEELPPAHRVEVTATGARIERYWRFRRLRSEEGRSREEVAADLRLLLRRSIARETDGLEPGQVALSLSGGLDSSALAALSPRGVQAFSWTFDEITEGDERAHVEELSRHLDLPVHWVQGDGCYPLCGDFADCFADPGSPHINAFAALKARLYARARTEGCTHVMVGDGGDALYAAQEYWLRDVLTGRRDGALASLVRTLGAARRGDPFAQLALKRLFPFRGLRSALRGGPHWLTPSARELLPGRGFSAIVPAGRRRQRYELSSGTKHIELESEERRLFARCGVERLNPFWSWPLLEMVLGLSADWYHRDGLSKVLTREAFRGLLPRRVLASGRVGLLGSFFLRGIELNRRWIRDSVLRHPRSDWPRYVEREYLESHLAATGSISLGHTILWRVISYELWQRRLIAGPGGTIT